MAYENRGSNEAIGERKKRESGWSDKIRGRKYNKREENEANGFL